VRQSFCFPGGLSRHLRRFLRLPEEDGKIRAVTRRFGGGADAVALIGGGLYDNLDWPRAEITIQSLGWRRQSCWGSSPHLVTRTGRTHASRGRIYDSGPLMWNNIQPAKQGAGSGQPKHRRKPKANESHRRRVGLLRRPPLDLGLLSGVGGAAALADTVGSAPRGPWLSGSAQAAHPAEPLLGLDTPQALPWRCPAQLGLVRICRAQGRAA